MNLYIGDKVLKINENSLERLDNGKSVTNKVYRNGNEVIKIFKKVVDEEFYKYFSEGNFKLNVISKPNKLLYDENKRIIANTSIYRDGFRDFKAYYYFLLNMNKDDFLRNFTLLYDDIKILGDKGIMVCDLTLFNCVFKDGILYHIDYGSFRKSREAIKINKVMYESFVECVLKRISFLQKGYYPEWVLSSDRLEILENNMSKNETVKEFVKRMV